jgi:YVTN family beta-propeller protein
MKKILMIALLALLTVNINCGGGGTSSDTSGKTVLTINLGEVRDVASLATSERGMVSTSSIPPHVVAIRITISAPDIPTIVEVISTAGLTSVSVTIEVPNGPNRHIVVEALNDTGGVLYSAETYVTLDGTPVSVPMVMAADPIPPMFTGLSSITSVTETSMVLSWLPATDNVTPQSKIQYLIYMATTSGGQNFSSPSFTTPLGATSYTVTGLSPNTTYYYVVWAMDEVGNKDGNMVERSATTLAPPDPNPPTFGGVESATALSSTEIDLQWSAATDDVTPSSNIVYLIYMATTSGGQNFATPSAITAPGATTYTIMGLLPDTTYYFVVRARDEAGNIDSNTVERSATTPDTTPPTVTGVSPGIGATNVPVTSTLTATFSEAMDPSTINTTTFTLANGGSPVGGTVSYIGMTATFTPSANLAYNTIYTATITTGARDIVGNALTANYSWTFRTPTTAFVTNYSSNTVSVININNNTVVATIGVGTNPYGVAVNPVTHRAYVANYGSMNVTVIDAATNTVVATVPTISADTPYGIAVNPNNNMIYVTEEYEYDIDYINGVTHTVASILNATNSYDFGIAINPNTNIAYVADWGYYYKIDTITNVVVGGPIGALGTSTSAFGVAVDPINNKVYVTDTSSVGEVNVLCTITDTSITTVTVGGDPEGVALHQTASRAYVANRDTDNVSVINTTTDTVVTTVNVGTFPMGVAVNQAANRAYIVNNGNNTVSVIDTTTNTVVATIVVGAGPMGVAVFP